MGRFPATPDARGTARPDSRPPLTVRSPRGRCRTLAGVTLLLAGAAGGALWWTSPDVTWLRRSNPSETAMMRYREARLRQQGRPVRRIWVWTPLDRISPYLIQAVLIAEDEKFFRHEGFDWESMRKALETNIRRRRIVLGGSTITQQLAKNLFLSPERSILRKVREAVIAYRLEQALSKRRILELYLNVVEWGPGLYGAEAAARTYFHKPAADLRLSEAIRLASVLPNPYRFSPLDDSNRRMLRKRRIIARRMFQRGWIDAATYQTVLAELGLRPMPAKPRPGSPLPRPEPGRSALRPETPPDTINPCRTARLTTDPLALGGSACGGLFPDGWLSWPS